MVSFIIIIIIIVIIIHYYYSLFIIIIIRGTTQSLGSNISSCRRLFYQSINKMI